MGAMRGFCGFFQIYDLFCVLFCMVFCVLFCVVFFGLLHGCVHVLFHDVGCFFCKFEFFDINRKRKP